MHQAFIEGEKEERFEIIKEKIQEKVEKFGQQAKNFQNKCDGISQRKKQRNKVETVTQPIFLNPKEGATCALKWAAFLRTPEQQDRNRWARVSL